MSGKGQLLSYGADTETARMRFEAALLRRLHPRLRRPARKFLYFPADLVDAVFDRFDPSDGVHGSLRFEAGSPAR